MGWASGSRVFRQIMDGIIPEVADKEARKRVYRPIIEAFEDSDWDTQEECMGLDEAYDELLREMYPGWYDDEA